MKTQTDDEARALMRMLHDEVDGISVGPGWGKIEARMVRRQAARRRWVPLAAAVACVCGIGVALAAPGFVSLMRRMSGDGIVTVAGPSSRAASSIWPAPEAVGRDLPPSWQRDPGQTARRFLVSLGVQASRLESTPSPISAGRSGATVVPVRAVNGETVSRVVLVPSREDAVWHVTSAESAEVSVRSPKTGDRFDPPLSVGFRTTQDADVGVGLYSVGRPGRLTQWSDRVDAATDWTANANFHNPRPGTSAYIAVIARDNAGDVLGVSVIPVTLGS
jgi:hypothetical protein